MECTERLCFRQDKAVCKAFKTEEPTVPEGCTVWYDGCNNCRVLSSGHLGCTKMFCEEKKQAYCKYWKDGQKPNGLDNKSLN